MTEDDDKPAPFPQPPERFTQEGPLGIRYDFCHGVRLQLPEHDTPRWTVRVWDMDTGTTLADTKMKGGPLTSLKAYYIRFGVQIKLDDETVFEHEYDARDRNVMVMFPQETLGDTIAWMPAVVEFQRKHGCRLGVYMTESCIQLFRLSYPDIHFTSDPKDSKPDDQYAMYYIGLFMEDVARKWNPCDYKSVGLAAVASYILGLDVVYPAPPLIDASPDTERPIPERYVCIAAQATAASKMWLNPYGWIQTVRQLKADGYRVICIDKSLACGDRIMWNFAPPGVEDQTGDRPLLERANWLRHCEFFIGLSSGLAWLAWALHKPVVMISGFTHPTTEFYTPYRVINFHACNSCWNEHRFDNKDFLWCPRHKGTPRHFECSHAITSHHVMSVVRNIPGYTAGPDLAKPA